MFQSTIIVDSKSEIKGKQGIDTYIVRPTVLDRREAIRIKDVQDMLSWCAKSSFHGSQKIVVIEELHKSSDAVPHALLKLLEEPPTDTHITITIDRAESALATIRSRCAIISADDLSKAELEQLGLRRVEQSTALNTITWREFATKSPNERLEWLIAFIKTKKDSQPLLMAWQSELVEALNSGEVANRVNTIKQLALLEEVDAALRQNVLPRLAWQYFQIRLQHLYK